MKTCIRVLAITGTPGTGKKTVGKMVAEKLGYQYIELNRLALDSGSVIGEDEHGFIADICRLRKALQDTIGDDNSVVVGHLVPQVLSKKEVSFVAVLRCSPYELEKRIMVRRYVEEKLRANLASEILDICLYEALNRFGEDLVSEFDTTGLQPSEVVSEILDTLYGAREKKIGVVDWLSLVTKRKELERFFSYI